MVTTGFGYDADVRIAQARVVTDLIGEVRDIRRLGAATLDFCWLARGWVDAYYEQGLKAWDVAAGILIAQEAGATVVGTGDPFGTDYILACSPGIAAELEGRLSTLLGH